jgi:hypothetical protein
MPESQQGDGLHLLHENGEDSISPEPHVFASESNIDQQMTNQYGPCSTRYDLQPQKPQSYDHLYAILHSQSSNTTLVDTVMTQYGFKNELNRLRTAGVDSVMKE